MLTRSWLFFVFFHPGPRVSDDFFGHHLRRLFITGEVDRVPAPTLGHGLEIGGILCHFGCRRFCLDNLSVIIRIDAHDAAAALVEVTHDVAQEIVRDVNLDGADRFEQDRRRLRQTGLVGQTGGNLEGHFR